MQRLIALIRDPPHSMEFSRTAPMQRLINWAPGAIPFISGVSGKYPAAIPATCVPWEPKNFKFFMLLSQKIITIQVSGAV